MAKRASTAATKTTANPTDTASAEVLDIEEDVMSDAELYKLLLSVKNGDFSVRFPVEKVGLPGKFCDALNDIIEMNQQLVQEIGKAQDVIGKRGKFTQQVQLKGAKGDWAECTDSINTLISDLVQPTTQIAHVISSVAKGDLSAEMPQSIDGQPLRGEFLRIAKDVNIMVKQLRLFSMEVTRVAKEVGTEGKLGGQAKVKGVDGVWKDLTDSVNQMASNLTDQMRSIANVTIAVARGDLSKKVTVDVKGEIAELKDAINTMVDQLNSFASEVTRVAREVGSEGKLGGQANVRGVGGVWKDLTDSVNLMAGNLTDQVRNIAQVTTAVARGDLSRKITVDVKGEILELKDTINTMVDQLNSFASEVTRVAQEVGSEGKLGGQAKVKGVAGVWKDLTDGVNQMASNLTGQVRNIAEVTTAVAKGDLSRKITVDVKGEIAELKDTINTMVDQLNSFGSEVTRVAREVGSEGKLGGQANVPGVAGTWKDLTDSVNQMASNLTGQVRNIAEVTTAVANGDLSRKITVNVKGEIAELKNTINTMVDQLNSFGSEVTRVALEVGTEGKLGGQANVKDVGGVWKNLTDSVNQMAGNLTDQVRNIAEVTTAVAKGDLSRKITVDVKGEIAELKDTINTMVDQLNSFGSEVTRVAREVGSEGKLGGQANVPGVAGTWKDLTDSVNLMAGNLTDQVRNIAEVTTAVAKGDLSKKITVDVKGEILELKNTINTMVDQLNSFGSEVTRVAREVGSEGKLGGQADVPGVAGTWKDLTDSVNLMAGNLTAQVRNIAEVTTAVAKGDLSRKITVDVKGEIAELKDTINTMVDQLRSFASEVTRVAREVGTDGKLGGQANVQGVAGTWKDLTDSVNQMAGNLTDQVRNIAEVAASVANGDLSKKITVDVRGEILQLKETINTMVDQLRGFASEVTRVAKEVGTEGKLGGQAFVPGVAGTWKDLTDSVNQMTGNLTSQVRNIAEVTKAVAGGDLSKTVTIDVKGEIFDLKNTINTMVDQLNSFAYEVTRVAREVGTEGKLGGQANVRGVAGTWKDLTDSVNMMASNLTSQVRGIAKVVTSVAKGHLKQKLSIEAKGEVAQLTDTINEMIDTLAVFADQVTTVAREVGAEGQLGGQANVPGASGIWKDLTENVNQLAANLTTQVRAIADVASAVTKGDLSRTINVMAKGEVEALKDTINQMITNLKATTIRNQEQDWLKSNLAKFTQMLQGQKELHAVSKKILAELAEVVHVQQGVFYNLVQGEQMEEPKLKMIASYAFKERKNLSNEFRFGEGLVGQCALEKERILLTNVPGDYIHQVNSGLGSAPPLNIVVLPVLFEGNVKAVIELATFGSFSSIHLSFLEQLTESIGIVLNTIESNTRTEALLQQSQKLAGELKSQQEELRITNEELEEKARLLAKQKEEVEQKNQEVEIAKKSLEEKASQLTITSQYKSEFLANMSHELRTPLNSLLILSQQLSENKEGNLNDKQVHYSKIIHSCGTDLINLINDILDLSKIESGVVTMDAAPVEVDEIVEYVETTFRHMAEYKKLKFNVTADTELPKTVNTDLHRLKQILKNLLSNAFKFTEKGSVDFHAFLSEAPEGQWADERGVFVAFSITDSGIGISPEKQNIIFEAFQQAEGSTSRKFGGTGLGLSISRGLATLLGGFIDLESEPGEGATFTIYIPVEPDGNTGAPVQQPLLRDTKLKADKRKPDASTLITKASLAPKKEAKASVEAEPKKAKKKPAEAKAKPMLDDREVIKKGDRIALLLEPTSSFAEIVREKAHKQGIKVVISPKADEALDLSLLYKPEVIIIDISQSDLSGWRTLNFLKANLQTRHIPVGIISIKEEEQLSFRRGGYQFAEKPVNDEQLDNMLEALVKHAHKKVKRLLVVEDNEGDQEQIKGYLNLNQVKIDFVETGKKAISAIDENQYDAIVVDLLLPDITGFEVAEHIGRQKVKVPLMVYSAKELTRQEEQRLDKVTQSIIPKTITSWEQLLDQAILKLHIDHDKLPKDKAHIIENINDNNSFLRNKKVLIVDDDIRNIFALTTVFEKYDSKILSAEGGKEALNILKKDSDIDIVLMDIMMPEMDGYETMQHIRKQEHFKKLPIIAVTAKAMRGDREKCIAAGASDYIIKPINTTELLSLIRLWL